MRGVSRQQMRRRARRALLQVLYEVDASGHSFEGSAQWVLETLSLDEESIDFVRTMAGSIMENIERLDREIERHAPAWPVAQLLIVDRNILRIALYEIVLARETPAKVAINEAVELAKQFGSDSLPRFVNGVLGAVMTSDQKKDDLIPHGSRRSNLGYNI